MTPQHFSTLLAVLLLLTACGEQEPAATSPAATPAELASPATKPTPVVAESPPNPAKLNQDLINAINFKQVAQARTALQAGADPMAKDRQGLPALFLAAQGGDPEVVKALLAAGADPNATIGTSFNDDGVGYGGTADGTVLGYAAARGRGQVMYDLVVAGAEVNGSGPNGTTPLMQAVESGKFVIVKWLIDAGADPNLKNKTGGTALGMAQMIVNPDPERQKIIALLTAGGQ